MLSTNCVPGAFTHSISRSGSRHPTTPTRHTSRRCSKFVSPLVAKVQDLSQRVTHSFYESSYRYRSWFGVGARQISMRIPSRSPTSPAIVLAISAALWSKVSEIRQTAQAHGDGPSSVFICQPMFAKLTKLRGRLVGDDAIFEEFESGRDPVSAESLGHPSFLKIGDRSWCALTQSIKLQPPGVIPAKFEGLTVAASFSNAFAAFSGLRLAPLISRRMGWGPAPAHSPHG